MTQWPQARRVLVMAATIAACARGDAGSDAGRAPRDSATERDYRNQPGYVIDSLLPMKEYLRRFRVGMTEPAELATGLPDREALVRAFMAALAKRDTVAMARMTLTKAEFAWLYFPNHPISKAPYELPPELTWFQIVSNHSKGRVRLLERFGDQQLRYRSHLCPESSIRPVGDGREYDRCLVAFDRTDGVRDTLRFFGPIFERRGKFKFVSFANDF